MFQSCLSVWSAPAISPQPALPLQLGDPSPALVFSMKLTSNPVHSIPVLLTPMTRLPHPRPGPPTWGPYTCSNLFTWRLPAGLVGKRAVGIPLKGLLVYTWLRWCRTVFSRKKFLTYFEQPEPHTHTKSYSWDRQIPVFFHLVLKLDPTWSKSQSPGQRMESPR